MRSVLSSLAVAFTAYLAVGAMVWTAPVDHPVIVTASVAMYLVVTWLCIFWRLGERAAPAGESRFPMWTAALALVAAVAVPNATWWGVGEVARSLPFATWSLGGIGALMAIVMVRGRPWTAWAGVVILTIEASLWIGVPAAIALGATGAIVWVGVAQLLTGLIRRAERDTAELTELQRAASEWLASQDGRRRERRIQVRRALAVAGPVLMHTIDNGGDLPERERREALLAEGRLRDELRGPRLLDDTVRTQLEAARLRGSRVTMLDEGGLDDLDDAQLQQIRERLAAALEGAASERLYIRTSPDPEVVVTVVGRSRA
ncbi:MAG: hypothetical protein ACK5KK_05640, partial [Microbacterium sp.]